MQGRLFSNIEVERIIHSIKTAIACLIGYAFTRYPALHIDQWLIITITVVMCAQINVGSMINKSYMRFLGTLTGSLLAGLTLIFFGKNPLAIAGAIALSTILFSYLATSDKSYSDSGTLGAVTVIIILLGQDPTIGTAIHRFLEISFGILIAALSSQFILPIHARGHIGHVQAETMEQLRLYYYDSLIAEPSEKITEEYLELDEAIVRSLSEQRSLAKQASREPFGVAFNSFSFMQLLRCEKEIFRSIVCMRYACDMLPQGRKTLSRMPAILDFHQLICKTLKTLAPAIEKQKFTGTTIAIPSLNALKEAVQASSEGLGTDELVYLNGFLFCAELLVVQLTQLVILLGKRT